MPTSAPTFRINRRPTKRAPDLRGTSTQRGYDGQWQRFRDVYLNGHPLCVLCGGLATLIDHRTPLNEGGARFDHGNLRC